MDALDSIIDVARREGISTNGFGGYLGKPVNVEQDWRDYGRTNTINEVFLSLHWLKQCQLRQTVDRGGSSSYGLKHIVENLYDQYVCNGAFLIACFMHPGVKVRRIENSLNACINLSRRNPTFRWLNTRRGTWRKDVAWQLDNCSW